MADNYSLGPKLTKAIEERTKPVPNSPGFRVDALGKVYYSAAWINEDEKP